MAEKNQVLAETFPPGAFIKEELEARGWLQTDLAEITGVDKKTVSEIVAGKRSITPETATLIGEAFGTGPAIWLNLDAEYQLSRSGASAGRLRGVARRAGLYTEYPVREMRKRGWISRDNDAEELERELKGFLSPAGLPFAARRSGDDAKAPLQRVWLQRAYHMARDLCTASYSETRLLEALEEARGFLPRTGDVAHIPRLLNQAGIRLLAVRALPNSRIDGACFWLDKKKPVVVLSMRLDRIDNFWFTLLHELQHIKHGHGQDYAMVDADIANGERGLSREERAADKGATEFLIPRVALDQFIAQNGRYFSLASIRDFAARQGVHPGIVVGRLQYEGLLPYSHYRNLLVKVCPILISHIYNDGW